MGVCLVLPYPRANLTCAAMLRRYRQVKSLVADVRGLRRRKGVTRRGT